MKFYVQFYQPSATDRTQLIEACGDRAVVILDARENRVKHVTIALTECRKRGYAAWQIMHAVSGRFDNAKALTEVTKLSDLTTHTLEDGYAVVHALCKATGLLVSTHEYKDWLEGGTGAYKFDQVVRTYLGEALYAVAEVCARLDLVLRVKLGTPVDAGHERDLAAAIIANPEQYTNGF